MSKAGLLVVLVALLAALAPMTATGGEQKVTVLLRDKTTIEGVILGFSEGVYRIRVGNEVREVPETEVQAILFDREKGGGAKPAAEPEEKPPFSEPFGDRYGNKKNLRAFGGGRHTESSVLMGLIWLRNHQGPNGLWSCRQFAMNCKKGTCTGAGSGREGEYDFGVSALATLAFLGAGHTHKLGKFKYAVKSALEGLMAHQDPSGCFGPKVQTGHWIYNHAICTLAMAEAFGLTKDTRIGRSAQKGVDFLVQCQNPYLGWRYGMRTGENDTSCTAWAITALHSARTSGLEVPETCFQGALNWFSKVTDPAYYKTGYATRGDTGARLQEAMGKFRPSDAMTAAAVACRIFIHGAKAAHRPEILGGGTLLKQNPPKWDVKGGTIDMYYWYWGTLAMFQLGRQYWKAWNEPLKNALVPTQKRSGCENGSWDPSGAWGMAGGRVYATAVNVLSLEIYYRYAKVVPNRQSGEYRGKPLDDEVVKAVHDEVMALIRQAKWLEAKKRIEAAIWDWEGHKERVARLKSLLNDLDLWERNSKSKERERWRRSIPLRQWMTLLAGRDDFLSNWRASADVKLEKTEGMWTISIGGGGHSVYSNFQDDHRWLDFELEFEMKNEVPLDLGFRNRTARRKFTGTILGKQTEWAKIRVSVRGVTAAYSVNGKIVGEAPVDLEPGGLLFRVRDAGKAQLRNLRIRVDRLGD
ncbi:MAG: prenyltransferase/squalene oxidase repeat-containing protein [Planctomycetota bacterium]|jgi:hypothetical protein